MKHAFALLAALMCIGAVAHADVAPPRAIVQPIPAENVAADPPPAMPAPGDTESRARLLFDAIKSDTPERASVFFFPREQFSRVKAIANPDGYWQTLKRAYDRDIHTLHARLANPEQAQFVRFEFSRRRTWQAVRSEANAIPYWCVRHNQLVYRDGSGEHKIEVRTLIHWGPRWFVTHLI